MDKKFKNKISLGNELQRSLVVPQDSEQRRRYIKGLIYGESLDRKIKSKVLVKKNIGRSILYFLQQAITGDDYLDNEKHPEL